MIFNQYNELSIKIGEQERRGISTALEIKIEISATQIPKQWSKYI
jgi:hypothetical protein